MYVSESSFLHLLEAEDERRSREREHRRMAAEREAETPTEVKGGLRQFLLGFRPARTPQRRLSHP